MSQAETQLAHEGGETLESIAAGMTAVQDVGEEQVEQEAEPEQEQEAAEQEEVAADDPEIEVEVDGKPQKVKKSEIPDLIRRGMFEADYRKKTAEAAEERRKVEAEAQQVQQKRDFLANHLEVFAASLHKELVGSQPDPSLIDSDPQEFMRQQAAYNQRAQQFNQVMQYRQALTAQQEQEQRQRQAEVVKREQEKLLEKMPELRDEKVRSSKFAAATEYLTSVRGFSAEELGGIVDHRTLMTALDAAEMHALRAAKAKQAKPDIPKPVRPGAASVQAPNTAKQKALDRLKRDPNDLDALAAAAFAS